MYDLCLYISLLWYFEMFELAQQEGCLRTIHSSKHILETGWMGVEPFGFVSFWFFQFAGPGKGGGVRRVSY